MAEVIALKVVEIGDGFHVDVDGILEAAKGQLISVVIAGRAEDGQMYLAMSDGGPESLWLLQHAKHQLLIGDDDG